MKLRTSAYEEDINTRKHIAKHSKVVQDGGVIASAVPIIRLGLGITIDATKLVNKDGNEIRPAECKAMAEAINKKLEVVNTSLKNLSATLAEHDIDVVSKRFNLEDFLVLSAERHARIKYEG